MDQSRCRRRGSTSQIALLDQDHPQPATGGIAREADTVQAATDDREVVICHETVEGSDAPFSLAGLERKLHGLDAADEAGIFPDRQRLA